MDVEPGQEVDVNIEQHTEDYVKPKKKYTPWGGAGQRLGSPTPGDVSTTNTRAPAPSPLSTSAPPAPVEVDEGQPMITLQIRLGDGTRLVSRFNTTHTIGDVYQFVGAASPTQRAWVLMTTFPNKELSDKGAVLGDLSEFKKGGVVVQKWQ
jgi:UBX domain-containing protein 1